MKTALLIMFFFISVSYGQSNFLLETRNSNNVSDLTISLTKEILELYEQDPDLYDLILFDYLDDNNIDDNTLKEATSLAWIISIIKSKNENEIVNSSNFFLKREGNYNRVFQFSDLKKIYFSVKQEYYDGASVMTAISINGCYKIFYKLIQNKADINFLNNRDRTLFSLAIDNFSNDMNFSEILWDYFHPKHNDLVSILEGLYNENIFLYKDKNQKVAIDYLLYNRNFKDKHPLCIYIDKETDLTHTAWFFHVYSSFNNEVPSFIDCFVSNGGDINITYQGDNLFTFWLKNIWVGTNLESFKIEVQQLVDLGVKLNVKNDQGLGAIEILNSIETIMDKSEVKQFLITKGVTQ